LLPLNQALAHRFHHHHYKPTSQIPVQTTSQTCLSLLQRREGLPVHAQPRPVDGSHERQGDNVRLRFCKALVTHHTLAAPCHFANTTARQRACLSHCAEPDDVRTLRRDSGIPPG